jgi:hypothetical protein
MKKYIVNAGYSQTTKTGTAHAGATIDANMLSIKDPEKYLEERVKDGKFLIVEQADEKTEKKADENLDPILTDSHREILESKNDEETNNMDL